MKKEDFSMNTATPATSRKARHLKQHPKVARDEEHKFMGLDEFLVQAGTPLNCRFILEAVASTADRSSALEAAEIVPAPVASIAELISKLQADLEEVQIEAVERKGDLTIIRLMETPLVGLRGYALDQQVSIEFTGSLRNLLRALKQQLPTVGPITGGGIPVEPDDYRTQTSIAVERQSVRTILTDAVPLADYGPLLWFARTYDLEQNPKTQVRFMGKQRRYLKQHPRESGVAPNDDFVDLHEFLAEAGTALNCRFIFEAVESTADRDSALEAAEIIPALVENIAELISKLQADLEEVEVEAVEQKGDLTIIRLMETPLVGLPDYALDHEVSIEFTGSLHDLLRALKQQLPTVGPVIMGSIPPEIDDHQTQTSITVEMQSVRTILTDAVPLADYGPLLWFAMTSNLEQNPKTEVRFLGGQSSE